MSNIINLPPSEMNTIESTHDITFPQQEVTHKAEKTGKRFGKLNLNQLFGAISDVATAATANSNQQQDQNYNQGGNRYNTDMRPVKESRILGMKPLVFTLTAVGAAAALGLLFWALTKK